MKKLLYIGHDYHNKTKSTQFLQDIFKTKYEVTTFSFNPYTDTEEKFLELGQVSYDVVVLFQIMPSINLIKNNIAYKKIVFFPMYDGVPPMKDSIWAEYKNVTIINFSNTLHTKLVKNNFTSYYIQYFPKPLNFTDWGNENSLFFWQRINNISINTVETLLNVKKIEHLHFHKAIDPGYEITEPSKKWKNKVTYSSWYDKKEDMLKDIEESALYMAPRHLEGIGMSFLEAMAMGRCVIAPNNPTMNEYIEDGKNGFLYNLDNPKKITLQNIQGIQKQSLEYIKNGYEKWEKEKFNILDWVETEPLVTVVTITYNLIDAGRKETFLQCVESVKKQSYRNIEHIIIDGASTDGSIALINSTGLTYYSEPDTGVYDAMNKGIEKAQGKYIAFLNSDDFWHGIDGVRLSVEALERENADFSCAPCHLLGEKDEIVATSQSVLGMFCIHMPISHQTMFTKTDYLRTIGGFDTSFKNAGDYELVIRIIMSGAKPVVLQDIFTSYRLSGLSEINKQESKRESILAYKKNFSAITSNTHNFHKIHERKIIPMNLIKKIKKYVHPIIAKEMQEDFSTTKKIYKSFKVEQYPPITRPLLSTKSKKRYNNTKKVLLITHLNFLLKDSGAAMYVYEIAKSLKTQGYEVDFFTTDIIFDFNKFNELNKAEKIIENFYLFSFKNAPKIANKNYIEGSWVNDAVLKEFQKILFHNEYDYINIHYIQWLDLIKYTQIPAFTKVIYSMQDMNFIQSYYNQQNYLASFGGELDLLQYVDEITCISYDEMYFFKKFLPNLKYTHLPHFLPEIELKENNKDIDVLLLAYNNTYNFEGLQWFIKNVCPQLEKNIKITICGRIWNLIDNDYLLREEINNYNIERIDFAKDLDELYSRCKISIVPIFKGTGLKIKTIDSLSRNVPIVSTLLGVDGFPDKIKNGCLVTDEPKEFALYINKMLSNKEFYQEKKLMQKKYFEQVFSDKVCISKIQKIFSSDENKTISRKQNELNLVLQETDFISNEQILERSPPKTVCFKRKCYNKAKRIAKKITLFGKPVFRLKTAGDIKTLCFCKIPIIQQKMNYNGTETVRRLYLLAIPSLKITNTDWYKSIHILGFLRVYKKNMQERYFRKLENNLIAQFNARLDGLQNTVTSSNERLDGLQNAVSASSERLDCLLDSVKEDMITEKSKLIRNFSADKTYSQYGEDSIMRTFYDVYNYKGFYIDIGANHPIELSNTHYFYERGWRGINIDALPGSMNLYKIHRPEDINLEIGIADEKGVLDFYKMNPDVYSSFNKKDAEHWVTKGHAILESIISVETDTINSVLEQYLPQNQKIDFITLDVEGFELTILERFNFKKYGPTYFIVEENDYIYKDFSSYNKSSIYTILKNNGYIPIIKTVCNVIYVKLEVEQ